MEIIYASDRRFWGKNDSETIQNAVDYASRQGLGQVTIPRINERTGESIWIIDTAVLLPSDMTILLDGCYIRMADDTRDNFFRNSNCWTEEGRTLAGEQHDIRILGRGRAVLDGGKPNGMCEQLIRDNPGKFPYSMYVNIPILMANVRHFEVRNLQIVDSRYWGITFLFCRWGIVSDIDFRMYGNLENQDGIDLRVGCEYITIQNITGITGDDTVALTALPWGSVVNATKVEGKGFDIHDITIRNVIASTHGCGVVRFLCEGGAKEYNITCEDIKDTTGSISGTSVIVGTTDNHFADPPHVMGDFRNIVLRNISTCGQRGISIAEAVQDMVIENLSTYGPNEVGIRFYKNFACDNLTIRNVSIGSEEESLDSAIWMPKQALENAKGLKIENVRVSSKAKYIFRESQPEVTNLSYEEPTGGVFSEEGTKLTSAYGRYHYIAYGKVIENRPKDNRFDHTLRYGEYVDDKYFYYQKTEVK